MSLPFFISLTLNDAVIENVEPKRIKKVSTVLFQLESMINVFITKKTTTF